jgi:hypothetical protein
LRCVIASLEITGHIKGGAGVWVEEGNATFTNCNFMTNKTGSTWQWWGNESD